MMAEHGMALLAICTGAAGLGVGYWLGYFNGYKHGDTDATEREKPPTRLF